MGTLPERKYRREIKVLLTVAMLLFVLTIVIGILNGTDRVLFNHKQILAHVHAGTLGWITLSVFASTLWLFGGAEGDGERSPIATGLSHAAAFLVVCYVLAFLTTENAWRPVLGGIVSVVFCSFFVWALVQRPLRSVTVPQLGFLVALFTSVVGGLLGTAWGVIVATDERVTPIPRDGVDAHPAMMVIGFLVPVAMAMAEWWIIPDLAERGPSPRPRAGAWQMGLLFMGAVLIMLGLLTGTDALIILSQPFLVASIVILFVRLVKPALAAPGSVVTWHACIGAIAVVLVIIYTVVLVNVYDGDLDNAPQRYIIALDHLQFIGAMTNSVFALLLASTVGRLARGVWDRVVFVAINVGLVGFWIGLVVDSTVLKRGFTPIMGTGILIGLGLGASRLYRTPAPETAAV